MRTNTTTNRLDGLTDPAGRTVDYDYSGDNLTGVTDLDGQDWTYDYASDLTRVTDPRGNQTRISYTVDSAKVTAITRVTDTVTGTGPTTTFAYYGTGNCPTAGITSGCTVVTDPNGNPTSHAVDSLDQVTRTVDALGHTQDTGYDTLGNVVALTGNGTGATTPASQIGYAPGTYKATSVATGMAGTSLFSYADPNVESPTSYTSPQGSALTYTYRGNGNLATIKTAGGGEDRYRADYHPDGALKTYSQPNLTTTSTTDRVTTTLSYTAGNLTGVDYPAPLGDVAFTVDSYSRRLTATDGRGQTTSYGYDDLDRVTTVTSHGGSSVSYGYDPNGNQTTRTATPTGGGSGATTTYTYDALNRVTAEAKPAPGPTVSFAYDAVGNLRFHTGPAGTIDSAGLGEPLGEPDRGVLGAGVGVVDQSGQLVHPSSFARPDRHLQRVKHQRGAHAGGRAPAEEAAGERVDDERRIDRAGLTCV